MHMAHNMHTWGRVQCCRVMSDLYVTFVAQKMSNDRFAILEPILPIVSRRRVTHYPRVTKKENKHGQQPQPSTKQTRFSHDLKRI